VDLRLPERFHQIRVPEKNYPSASLRKAHWEHVLVPQEMEKWKVDRAHFLYPSNPKRRLQIPTIVTVHDVIPWKLSSYRKRLRSKLYHFYARMALKKADHIITVRDFSKSEIMKMFKIQDKHISVVPLAPPTSEFDLPLPDLSLRRDFLLYVGGYDDRKNVPFLLEAYQKHIANDYAIDFILVGAKDKGLEHLITEKHSQRVDGRFPVKPKGRIIFTPTLSDTELSGLLKQARAMVHVSKYEGFNLPMVEAMVHGLPIVAADIPVNREVTAGNALFVDPYSVDSIGLGIHQMLNDHAMQNHLSDTGLIRAKDFSWEKSANSVQSVYNLFT